MKQKGSWVPVFLLVFLASSAGLWAAKNYKVLNGPDRFYFGHISYTEAKSDGKDPVVLREGQVAAEAAVLNLPLGPGDTIRTTADRRCEIQFDTGTVIRLDFDTEVKIETVLAQSLSSSAQLSNLALNRGRIYVMYKEYDSREMFQVLTPIAAIKMSHRTVATIRAAADGSTEAQVKFGKANVLFGPDEQALKKQGIKKSERLVVLNPTQFERTAYLADSDFELWNDEINARFSELHKGQSALPKPIQKLPPAVFYFAQQYGNVYGEWLWDSMYGYVWRPFLDQHLYPWGWAPYFYGNWSSVGGQMYWVPEEPWGWIPYHLGIWQWDEKLGWVWLPGSLFAPAWVDWAFFYGYFGWRPWSLFDWIEGFYTDFDYMNGSWLYGWGRPGYGLGFDPPLPGGWKPALTKITKDQLKQPGKPSLGLPHELKGIAQRVLAAYKQGDQRVLDSMKHVPSQAHFVAKQDLNSLMLREKVVTWDKVPKLTAVPPAKGGPNTVRKPIDARQEAARTYRGNEAVRQILHRAGVPGRVQKTEASPATASVSPSRPEFGAGRPAGPGVDRSRSNETMRPADHPRFLDWNPDIKVARELGVRIEYSSQKNEVRCPELKLSSADRLHGEGGFVPSLTPQGVSYVPASSLGSGGSNAGGSPSGSGPGTGGGAHGGSTKEGSSSSGGGGAIKN